MNFDDFGDRAVRWLEGFLDPSLQPYWPVVIFAILVAFYLGKVAGGALAQIAIAALRDQLVRADERVKIAHSAQRMAETEAMTARLASDGVRSELSRYVRRVREAIDGAVLTRPYHDGQPLPWAEGPSRIPILAIGNLKGGVGKTTLAANLGAYFADTRPGAPGLGQRVLFLDLDFQGSLSETLTTIARDENRNRVQRLFEPGGAIERQAEDAASLPHPHMSGCRFFDCDFGSIREEDRKLFDWAVSLEQTVDPRLVLARFLYHPAVQASYDVVVLDLPPRNTLYGYNALIAATHLAIPTRADPLSSRAVSRMLKFVEQHRTTLWPHLRVAGVVATMTQELKPSATELATLTTMLEEAEQFWRRPNNPVELLGSVPTRAAIAQTAGESFAYFADPPSARPGAPVHLFAAIGGALVDRIGLASRETASVA